MVIIVSKTRLQPSLKTVSVNVNDPDAEAFTVTVGEVVPDEIVPPVPVSVQECVTVPPTGNTLPVKILPVELAHKKPAPEIFPVGTGFTVIVIGLLMNGFPETTHGAF